MATTAAMRPKMFDLMPPLVYTHLSDQYICHIEMEEVKNRKRINNRQCHPVLGKERGACDTLVIPLSKAGSAPVTTSSDI